MMTMSVRFVFRPIPLKRYYLQLHLRCNLIFHLVYKHLHFKFARNWMNRLVCTQNTHIHSVLTQVFSTYHANEIALYALVVR